VATLTIPDSTYERLQAKAAARKLSVGDFLGEIAAESAPIPADSARQLAALLSFSDGTSEWTSKHLPPGHVVDDSRAKIYEGRGG
jgi:hypothetical protein